MIQNKLKEDLLFVESESQIDDTFQKIHKLLVDSNLSTMSSVFVLQGLIYNIYNPE